MACRCGIAKVGISTMFSHRIRLVGQQLVALACWGVGSGKGGCWPSLEVHPPSTPSLFLYLYLYLSTSLSLSLSDHNSRTGWLPGARIVSAHSGRAGEWKPFYISISICLDGCGMAGCAMAGCAGGRGNSHRLINGGVTQYDQRTATASGLDDVDDV